MSKLPPEAHNVLGTVHGVKPDVFWADYVEEPYQTYVQVCVEVFEGQKMAYFAALSEQGRHVRVDLDAAGWRRLAELATDAAERAEKAEREELP